MDSISILTEASSGSLAVAKIKELFVDGVFPHQVSTSWGNSHLHMINDLFNNANYTTNYVRDIEVGRGYKTLDLIYDNYAINLTYSWYPGEQEAETSLAVFAQSAELAGILARKLREEMEIPPTKGEKIPFGFWRAIPPNGYARTTQELEVPNWDTIARNYNSRAAGNLEKLAKLETLRADHGKILLLHGSPGTGKTTLIRALSKEWEPWCVFDCILDPERFFQDPNYILDVILTEPHRGDRDVTPWRLLILEDCDELIGGEAKKATGQALSRLLNLSDGILGQGKKILVLITTNENITGLHPAVTRPGRCLAQIEIEKFPYAEAIDWLGYSAPIPDEGATLAELYAIKNDSSPLETNKEHTLTGQYL